MGSVSRTLLKILILWAALIGCMIGKGLTYTDTSVPPFGTTFYNIFCVITVGLIVITIATIFYFIKQQPEELKTQAERLLIGSTAIGALFLPSLVFMGSGLAYTGATAGDLFLYGSLAMPGLLIGLAGFVSLRQIRAVDSNSDTWARDLCNPGLYWKSKLGGRNSASMK